MAKTPAWQRKEGQNPKGGLNEAGRKSYKKQTGGTLKAPVKSGDNPRRASFLGRMGASKGPDRDSEGKPTRKLLSLQAWGASSSADARKKAAAISKRNKEKKGKK
jgi:hypothetical protein